MADPLPSLDLRLTPDWRLKESESGTVTQDYTDRDSDGRGQPSIAREDDATIDRLPPDPRIANAEDGTVLLDGIAAVNRIDPLAGGSESPGLAIAGASGSTAQPTETREGSPGLTSAERAWRGTLGIPGREEPVQEQIPNRQPSKSTSCQKSAPSRR